MNDGLLVSDPHVRAGVEMQNANFGWWIQEEGIGEEGEGSRRLHALGE